MVGRKHTHDEILTGAIEVAYADGFSRLTYGRVAKRLGIADRTVVYYFETKDALVEAVLVTMGLDLQERLATTLDRPVDDHLQLARAAWPVLAHPDAQPVFDLFFEASGLAVAGREPYDTIVPQLIEGWIAWATTLLTGTEAQRRVEAAASVALVDGLLLVRQLAGADTADAAARRLGVVDP